MGKDILSLLYVEQTNIANDQSGRNEGRLVGSRCSLNQLQINESMNLTIAVDTSAHSPPRYLLIVIQWTVPYTLMIKDYIALEYRIGDCWLTYRLFIGPLLP